MELIDVEMCQPSLEFIMKVISDISLYHHLKVLDLTILTILRLCGLSLLLYLPFGDIVNVFVLIYIVDFESDILILK